MSIAVETLENEQKEEQKEWSVQDINNLLGLTVSGAKDSESITSQVSSEEELETTDPKPEKRQKLAKNPLAKLTIIALTCGCGALFLALLLTGWNSLSLNSAKVTAQNQADKDKPEEPNPNPLLQRNAQLTGELALSQQKQQMRAIREKLDAQQGEGEIPKPQINPQTKPQTEPKVSPPPATVAVSQRTVPRRVVSPPSTVAVSQQTVPRRVSPTVAMIQPHRETRNPQEPLQQWQKLAQLGSYRTETEKPQPGTGFQPRNPQQTAFLPNSPETTTKQIPPKQTGNRAQIVRPGQVIKGELKTPVVWSGVAKREAVRGETEDESFIVSLSEPLTNAQGQEILAAGTEVMFGVKGVGENGLVNVTAIAVIREGIEYPLPANSLKLRSQNGSPLIAQRRNDSQGEMAGADTAAFLLGALGKVGELTNRATSSTVSSGIGGFTQSQSYSKTNYVGGLLEGGLNPLNQQWQQRNQERYQQLQNQPGLWWLESGSEVQIFVTHSFSIGGN